MENIAGEIDNTFESDIHFAVGYVQAAHEAMASAHARVSEVTAESGQERAAELRELLGKIASDLGGALADIAHVQSMKGELFGAWGIGSLPVATQIVEGATPYVQSRDTVPHEAPPITRYLLKGISVLTESAPAEEQHNAKRILGAMERMGVVSVRDGVLMGTDGLASVRTMGPARAAWLKAAVERQFPGATVPKQPSGTTAAQLCNSLDDVPLAVLDPEATLLIGRERLSVGDLVNKSLDEIVPRTHLRYISSDPESTDHKVAIRNYETLLAKAKVYAAQFNAAKEAKGNV